MSGISPFDASLTPGSPVEETLEISAVERLAPAPVVSVLMITYNHAQYLSEAIESVVAQECSFPFELIIGEDASSDDSRHLVLEYQRRYPHVIRVVYSAQNVGMIRNARRILAKARGDYVAYCEGDDYWRSRDKLARQVELIRRDPRIGIVHSDWVRARLRDGHWKFDLRKSVLRKVPLQFLEGDIFKTWYFPKVLRTCTVLVRRDAIQECFNSALGSKRYKFGDNVRNAYLTSRWRVAYLQQVSSVYRQSTGSALRSGAKVRVALYKSCLEFDTDARSFYSDRPDYPPGFRWEASVSLLLWAVRAADKRAAVLALKDLKSHFGVVAFLKTGWRALMMRIVRRGTRSVL
jgi:glycosyltransferase involved in cell wall biosynthesis